MAVNPASDALKRFTVLDLTRVRAGPTCVRQLADWGANVIKIELPEAMDGGNALGGARHGPDFMNLHRNKRAMTLNLKNEKGVELLKRLVKTADVIVENYRPDVKQRLGIDYDALSKENPKLTASCFSIWALATSSSTSASAGARAGASWYPYSRSLCRVICSARHHDRSIGT